jgi:poly-gamma-glutamate synthesis protein (capsule biosynthesis protein)
VKRLAGLLLLLLLSPARGEETRIRLMFAGDVMGHDAQIAAALSKNGTYDYAPCFRYVKPIVESADLAVANLEATLAGPPYTGYPRFSSPDALADALKDAGFDLLLDANNHACDRGGEGLARTLKVLDEKKLLHTGAFASAEDRKNTYPLLVEVKGIRIAFLNATYGTNLLTVPDPYSVNGLDEKQIKTDLKKTREMKPDLIIMAVHWGVEYERKPNRDQLRLAKILFKNKVNIIVGSHPHVLQEIRAYGPRRRKRLVFYSVGNFLSNQRDRYRDGGMIAQVEVVKDRRGTRIVRYGFTPTWVWRRREEEKPGFFILPDGAGEGLPDLGEKDKSAMDLFLSDARALFPETTEYKYRFRFKLDAEELPAR